MFGKHIAHVFKMGSEEQVLRIHTERVIAGVANKQIAWFDSATEPKSMSSC